MSPLPREDTPVRMKLAICRLGLAAGQYNLNLRDGKARRAGRKFTVEECFALSAAQLATMPPAGILHWNKSSIGYIFIRDLFQLWLTYSGTWSQTRQQESVGYCIRVATTQPRFGGFRLWFAGPLLVNGVPCNRRVDTLYVPPGRRYFGCRHCHRLTYASRQGRRKEALAGL
ncbi:MAG TPA: hypothetical protein VKU02_06230 [Gemmataceae bacterium]|nr:hypothetical protein [Gemmataceae bacterium]